MSLNMPCTVKVFLGKKAWHDLLDVVEEYFTSSSLEPSTISAADSAHQTILPPLFLQGPYHSLTIIGIEILGHSKRQLLVFDPGWSPPSALRNSHNPSKLTARIILWRYRRGKGYLKRYSNYELLYLDKKL
jgi:zinc finger-containing ubiquitin peptidase 1